MGKIGLDKDGAQCMVTLNTIMNLPILDKVSFDQLNWRLQSSEMLDSVFAWPWWRSHYGSSKRREV